MAVNYIGWHLAAAVPRASKAVPGLDGMGTSGPHVKLKTTSLGHHLKTRTSMTLQPLGFFSFCSGFIWDVPWPRLPAFYHLRYI